MNEEQILNNIPKITIGVNVFIDFEYTDIDQETLEMSQSQLIDFIENSLFNEIGIDSLGGATDVQLKHYTYETGNDFIQDKVSHWKYY